jgi:hypothetical protein
MRRFAFAFSVVSLLLACKDEQVVVIKADASAADAAANEPDAHVEQPPAGTQTDSGVPGRRLGDKGCKTNEDCDSNVCFMAATEADNFCTRNCTKASAATDCPSPLPGTCSRQLVCDAPE